MTDKIYLGLMSGTSLDAVDAVAVRFQPELQLLATHSRPLPTELRAEILALTQPGDNEIERMGRLDVLLGHFFAQTANELITTHGLSRADIAAVGSHGQTIRHRPQSPTPFSLQIADPNLIAELTGLTVVADFRRRDVAAGGQGAPLVPAFHEAILRSTTETRVVLNLGGMANITVLPAATETAVCGFDTGPANVLLDAWCQRERQQAYDAEGAWAAQGHVQADLLEQLLAHPFFARQPPKSTGREDFHLDWLLTHLQNFPALAGCDVQATLVELTAHTVAEAIRQHAGASGSLWLCGGGAYNRQLLARLAALLPGYTLHATAEIGLAATWVEAAAFAWLAQQTLTGAHGNLPAVTGARGERILGGIYPA